MQTEIDYQKRLNFELQQTGITNPHPVRQWYSAKTYVHLFTIDFCLIYSFFLNSGTLYRPEKPAMFNDDLKFPPPHQPQTAPSQQSRSALSVPIVYH